MFKAVAASRPNWFKYLWVDLLRVGCVAAAVVSLVMSFNEPGFLLLVVTCATAWLYLSFKLKGLYQPALRELAHNPTDQMLFILQREKLIPTQISTRMRFAGGWYTTADVVTALLDLSEQGKVKRVFPATADPRTTFWKAA